ncbi:unnamed protein product [Umbelopsis ramanniana]
MATNYADLRKVMTGEIIVKCRCGDEIRRIPINQTPTYDELCIMIFRLFAHKISNIENIILRYADEDGDLIVLSDDMDIVHAISQRNVLKVTIFDKERHPLPRDSWDQGSQSVTQTTLNNLERDLLSMRETINDLLGRLGEKKPSEEKHNHSDADDDKPSYKHLSTTDMAEFLEESQSKRKDSYNLPSDITSSKKSSPSAQRQSIYSYPQPAASAPAKAPVVTNNQQYYSPYQQPQQQASAVPSYPQQQPPQQPQQQQPQQQQPQQQQPQQQPHQTVKPPPQPTYAAPHSYRPSPNHNSAAPAPPYGQPSHQHPVQGIEPHYQQARPPQPQSSHLQNAAATPIYSQPQATGPSYSYPDNNRWR